jgi:UDPglucose--hexose-1-phosphate uridylyltransferase
VSEVRHDPLSDSWVIMAPSREARPEELVEAQLPGPPILPCPFCAGNEQQTPPATLVINDSANDDADNWLVRVVPNKYSAIHEPIGSPTGYEPLAYPMASEPARGEATPGDAMRGDAMRGDAMRGDAMRGDAMRGDAMRGEAMHRDLSSGGLASSDSLATRDGVGSPRSVFPREAEESLLRRFDVRGGHEVIIESPLHVQSLTELDGDHVLRVFEAYRKRLWYWFSLPGTQYAIVFKNVGAAAGASLRHSHSQLITTSIVPPPMSAMCDRLEKHFVEQKACMVCRMLAAEIGQRDRVVMTTTNFVAYCPFASRTPYLIRVVPRIHQCDFQGLGASELKEFAELVRRLLLVLEAAFVPPAYNYFLQTRPRSSARPDAFHWHFELFPRLTKLAGFEWGTGSYINTVLPEAAAGHLRGLARRFRSPQRRRTS